MKRLLTLGNWIDRTWHGLSSNDQRDVICLLLALIVMGTYLPVTQCGFVNYDDPGYVSANPNVNAGLTLDSLKWSFTTLHGNVAYWHPITWISHQLDFQLFRSNARAHHLTSVLIHAASTVWVFLIAKRLTFSIGAGFITALLWGIHPLRVESVAWISERKDVLCGFFYFATIHFYLLFGDRPTWKRYAAVLVCFVFSLMSKPMAVTLPCVLLLLDFWPLGRIRSVTSGCVDWKSVLRVTIEKLPLIAIAAAGSFFAFKAQQDLHAVAPVSDVPVVERFANASVAYVAYVQKTFLPIGLSVHYDHPRFHPAHLVGISTIAFGVLTAVAIRLRRKQPLVLLGWLWFAGTLVPTIGLIQVGSQWMANRYTYIPAVGLLLMIIAILKLGIAWAARTSPALPRSLVPVGTALVGAMLVGGTERQIATWKNTETLFTQAVKVDPNDHVAHVNLGAVHEHAGRTDLALNHYRTAILSKPKAGLAKVCMARILTRQGKPEFALPLLMEALGGSERVAHFSHEGMGTAYAKLRQFGKAIHHYRQAIKAKPSYGLAKIRLAELLATTPDPNFRNGSDAVALAIAACESKYQSHAGYQRVLAAAYAESGDFDKAIQTAEAAAAKARYAGNSILEDQIRAALCSFRDGKALFQEHQVDLCDATDAHAH